MPAPFEEFPMPNPSAKSRIAATAASVTRRILGSSIAQPQMVKMPKAKHQLHVSKTDYIPAGTILTDELLDLANIDEATLGKLTETGAIVMVDVLASAVEPDAEPEA